MSSAQLTNAVRARTQQAILNLEKLQKDILNTSKIVNQASNISVLARSDPTFLPWL